MMSQALAVPQTSTSALVLLRDDMGAALGFASQEKASATRAAYQSDFRIFSAYCDARGLVALPAAADPVAAFISAEAKGGAKASTIGGLSRDRPPDRRHPLRAQAGGA